ncbi:MAG: penicillin-binding transpeptidase domain-containing protein [Myxococcota bacterium]
MKNFELQEDHDFSRFAVGAAALSCFAVALTTFSAGADEPPELRVRHAVEAAERAAATETALSAISSEDDKEAAEQIASAGMAAEPVSLASVPDDWVSAGLDPAKATLEGDKYVQTLADGSKVTLTLDPKVQTHLDKMLENYRVPHGGIVLLEPDTGRVLAMASHTNHEPAVEDLARRSRAPSASVFKIVTAAALLESGAVGQEDSICYHGGRSRLSVRNIKGDPGRDQKCATIGDALAWSINSIMAKLAYKHIGADDMAVWAEKFGYNTEIPFELPVEMSKAEAVGDPLERARMAAGFWHTYLSPLHGAMIAAAVENDGVMMRPTIIDSYASPKGNVLYEFEPKVFRRVISKDTAATLANLLQGTADFGTARRYFGHRRAFPNDVTVGGKTGTLSEKEPYLGFTWFVGFGRHNELGGVKAAVAGLVCNTPKWRIKGPYAASEALREYFDVSEARARARQAELAANRAE